MSSEFFADKPTVFTAKYDGSCALPTCERRQVIEQGDACTYSDGELMHMRCSRRVERGESDPYCSKCFCYHQGGC